MSILTTLELKQHLRLDGADEDGLLATYKDAAEGYVAQYLNRPVPWGDDADGNEVAVPAQVKAAALLVAGDLDANRESSLVGVTHSENPAVKALLDPYRVHPGF